MFNYNTSLQLLYIGLHYFSARITSSPETIGVYSGQTARLKCSVTNRNDVVVIIKFQFYLIFK